MGPSQPSLQMQVKVSPPPTQVPPLEQGLEAHVLFLAMERESESRGAVDCQNPKEQHIHRYMIPSSGASG